ncbi:MAG: hypothetical protein KAS53_00885 [Candidatus Cloacimonetes bacterium]|nr:hypothetical protein [Candidatus Cloacimonadota bacterium]
MNVIKYNPLYSIMRYSHLKTMRRIQFPRKNIGKEILLKDSNKNRIFLEIDILSKSGEPKSGNAIFKIIFHSPKISPEIIIKRTKLTIPFFSGLPGFCTKQFMVNKEERTFSGKYEWETVEMAKNYARSYAIKFMKRRSDPFPISYEIIDKSTGKIVESSSNNINQ